MDIIYIIGVKLVQILFSGNVFSVFMKFMVIFCYVGILVSQRFYLLIEKPLGRYFQVRSPYFQAEQWN